MRARVRIDRDEMSGAMHPGWAARWRALLDLPLDALASALVDPGDMMTAARSATPFAGVLTAGERWALWRSITAPS